MAAIDDLQAAEANEEAVLAAYDTAFDELKAEVAALKGAPNQNDAIEAVVAKMTAIQKAASDKLNPPTDTISGSQASA